MRTLTVSTHGGRTHWQTATQAGAVEIRLPPVDDAEIVHELAALHWLLTTREVLGSAAGEDVKLEVSFGAIKKLSLKKTAKRHLSEWGRFLHTRFRGATVSVAKETFTYPGAVVALRYATAPVLRVPAPVPQGKAEVTEHALLRFATRFGIQKFADAWPRLCSMLASERLRPAKLPPEVIEHKDERYDERGLTLHDPATNAYLVFAGRPQDRLVTTYLRI